MIKTKLSHLFNFLKRYIGSAGNFLNGYKWMFTDKLTNLFTFIKTCCTHREWTTFYWFVTQSAMTNECFHLPHPFIKLLWIAYNIRQKQTILFLNFSKNESLDIGI